MAEIFKLISRLLSFTGHWRTLLLGFLFVVGSATPVFAVNFNAYWSYRQSGGEEQDTISEFQQRYSLGVGQTLTYRPSHAITASANVGYTRSETESGGEFIGVNNLNTSAQLNLTNDIFRAGVAGNTSIRSARGNDSTLSSWNASLGSMWNIPLWPSLSFNYSETAEPAPTLALFSLSGQKETSATASVNWDLILARFSYLFSNQKSEDPIGNSFSDFNSHFVRIDTDGRFWDNRVTLKFAQQFQYATQDISIGSEGGFFDLPIDGAASVKITQDLLNENDPQLTLEYNNDFETVSTNTSFADGEFLHIRFETANNIPENISILRLVLPVDSSAIELQQVLDLQWNLYTRDNDSTLWQQEPVVIQGVPSEDREDSIELIIDLTAAEFLLVSSQNSSGDTITITQIEAFSQLTTDFSSTSTNHLTNFGLGYRITSNLRALGNFTLEQNEIDSDDGVIETTRRSVNGNLRWTPLPFISPALSFSEYRDDSSITEENISRSYAFTVSTKPLESMNISFGYTHNDRFIGNEKINVTDRYTIVTKAQIYPDLSATWTLSHSEAEILQADDSVRLTNTYSSTLRFTAHLAKKLSADLDTNYSRRKNEVDDILTDTFQNGDARFNLRYRPSDILSVTAGYQTFFLDNPQTDRLNINTALQLINTNKARLSLTASHTQSDNTANNFAMVGSWNISRYFSLTTVANLRLAERSNYNFRVNLSFRL